MSAFTGTWCSGWRRAEAGSETPPMPEHHPNAARIREHHSLCDDDGWDHFGPCVIEGEACSAILPYVDPSGEPNPEFCKRPLPCPVHPS